MPPDHRPARAGAGRPRDARQPQADVGEPRADVGRPRADVGEPPIGAGQPSVGAGQPSVGGGRGPAGGGRPARAGAGRPRAGLSPGTVVDAALAVVDADGVEALTLARVATAVGVASPSLYKHVPGLPALRRLVTLRVQAELVEVLRDAVLGRSTDDAVRALARAYRGYLRRYPKRHTFVEAAPDPTDADLLASAERLAEVAFAVLRGYGLDGADLVHATRCLRAAVHGFAGLEALGGFGLPESVDESFERLTSMITQALRS